MPGMLLLLFEAKERKRDGYYGEKNYLNISFKKRSGQTFSGTHEIIEKGTQKTVGNQ